CGTCFSSSARLGRVLRASKRFEKGQQGGALFAIEFQYMTTSLLRFAAVPEYGFHQVACAAVVQEAGVAADCLGQTDAPQRRGPPFAAAGLELRTAIGQAFAHVVQQQVGIGANQLVGQLRFGGVDVGGELRCVAALAAGTVE